MYNLMEPFSISQEVVVVSCFRLSDEKLLTEILAMSDCLKALERCDHVPFVFEELDYYLNIFMLEAVNRFTYAAFGEVFYDYPLAPLLKAGYHFGDDITSEDVEKCGCEF